MGQEIMRVATLAAIAALGIVPIAAAPQAKAEIKHYELNIPRQTLDAALKDFAQQTGLQVGRFSTSINGSALVGPLQGNQTLEEALRALLSSQGLTYKVVDETTIAIINPNDFPSATGSRTQAPDSNNRARPLTTSPDPAGTRSQDSSQSGNPKSIRSPLHLAQSDQGSSQSTASLGPGEGQGTPVVLQEVVVTAEKREERLQDVPVPVSTISAQTLLSSDQAQLRDYFSMLPGLSLTPSGGTAAIQTLAIRGITTGGNQNPTVGITVDDVPFGASTAVGTGGGLIPDIDPADLARVEVLRGPQGTLYGASSMGGLLKYVTIDPSTDGFSGILRAGLGSIHNGDGVAYNASGAFNVPLGEQFALRFSGFYRQTPGYVDNTLTLQRGANEEKIEGGRISALWKPTQDFSIKLGALIQETSWDGSSSVFLAPNFRDLQQSYLPGTGGQNTRLQAYSALISARFGTVDLTSVTGYNVNSYFSAADVSSALGGAPIAFTNDNRTDKFTQEIRLSMPIGSSLEWLVGGFYTHETSSFDQDFIGVDVTTGVLSGSLLAATTPTSFQEYAGFTDLTWKVSDAFDIQFGGRESHIKQRAGESISTGPFAPGGLSVTPAGASAANVFTYLVTPRFRIAPDIMLYARLASGYRAGGPNVNYVLAGAPSQYSPDKTQNYEVGAKGDFLGHTLSVDASVYYIDWRDIQLQLFNTNMQGTYGFIGNGNKAKSQGLELSVQSRPLTGLTASAWVALSDAELTQDFPTGSSVAGLAGDRLPLSSRFSGNVSLEQSFPLFGPAVGFVGGAVSYVGYRQGSFNPPGTPRSNYPAYAQTNFKAGARYNEWTTNIFLNNATDRRGILAGGVGFVPVTSYQIIQPRTIGLTVTRNF